MVTLRTHVERIGQRINQSVAQSRPRSARWQSGHAAACKAAYSGSIPLLASIPPPISLAQHNLASYDPWYVALAEALDLPLATLGTTA